jgi:hypothetical protein
MKSTNDSEMGKQEVIWVPAAKVQGEIVAEILASNLRAAEIPVQVIQESVGHSFGISIGPLGTVSVMVPEEYLEQAKELLDLDPELTGEEVECPYCGVILELDEQEIEQGWFTCPECEQKTNIVFEE